MKKLLLTFCLALVSLSLSFGQLVNADQTGFRVNFDKGDGTSLPCWAQDDVTHFASVETGNDTWLITGQGTNHMYDDGIWYGINNNCGETQRSINVSTTPTIRVRARSNISGTVLRIQMIDTDDRSTNCDACSQQSALTTEFATYTLNYSGNFQCQYGGACEGGPVAVNAEAIEALFIAINPGTANFAGEVEIDWIEVGNEVPDAPDAPEIDYTLDGTVASFTWTATGDSYVLQIQTEEEGPWVDEYTGPLTSYDWDFDGLASGSYGFRIAAITAGMQSEWAYTGVDVVADAPDAPTNFDYTYAAGDPEVVFTWDGTADDFLIEREDGTDNWIAVESVTANTWTWVVGESAPGLYNFRVAAVVDGVPSAWAYTGVNVAEADDDPVAPATPANLTVSDVTENSVTLAWDDVTGADSYSIRYSVPGVTGWTEVHDVTSPYVLTGLEPETEYAFGVSAVEGGLRSDWSADVTATTEEEDDDDDTEVSRALAKMRVTLNIYPNPTTDATRIDYDAINGMDIQISVANMMGNEVARFAGSANGASFDASSLQKGIYIVNILAAGEVIGVERLVVK